MGELIDEIAEFLTDQGEPADVEGEGSGEGTPGEGEGEGEGTPTEEEGEGEGDGEEGDDDSGEGGEEGGEEGEGEEEESGEGTGEGEEGEGETDTELEEIRTQNAALLARVEELSTPVAPTTPVTPVTPVEVPGLSDLLSGMNFEEVIASKEDFVKFLGAYALAVQTASVEQSLVSTPEVVGRFITRKAANDKVKEEFYQKHSQLKAIPKYVTKVAEQVGSEHTDWTVEQVLEETAKLANTTLGLKDVVEKEDKVVKSGKKKPAFAKSGGKKTPPSKDSRNVQQREMDDLIDDVI